MSETLVFPTAAFAVDAIKKAAYRFSNLFAAEIRLAHDQTECVLHFDKSVPEGEHAQIIAAFRTEVLDQDLRAVIAKETEPVRNAILAHVFSKTGLQGDGQ